MTDIPRTIHLEVKYIYLPPMHTQPVPAHPHHLMPAYTVKVASSIRTAMTGQ